MQSVDRDEVAGFEAMAEEWWDPDGPMRPLHRLNPVRLGYIRDRLCRHFGLDGQALRPLGGLRVLDAGCGAGLLSEPLARLGAEVVGIDAGAETIAAAAAHAGAQGLRVDYRSTTAESLARAGERFDAVISMEVVEHVADLPGFIKSLVALTRPGGALLLSTLNRTLRSYALAIVGAEYVLRWVPRGTHDWNRFVRPGELRRLLRAGGAELEEIRGMALDLRSRDWRLTDDASVNYLALASRPAERRRAA